MEPGEITDSLTIPPTQKPSGALPEASPGFRVFPTDVAACVLAILTGALLASLPHLIWWPRLGEPVWIADQDDLFYLSIAAKAYHKHPLWLSDPVSAEGGRSIYRPLPLLPGVLTASALGLGPLRIGLIWRLGAGITVALSLYLFVRHYVPRPWAASALTIVLLADTGLLTGKPVGYHLLNIYRVLSGHGGALFATKPLLHTQWRVATPALTMAYLVVFILAMARAWARPSWGRLALAGAAFGLLFHVYFYYWTAAGLALLLALGCDARRRTLYVHVGWIGGLIGLPALIGDLMSKSASSDWLLRSDKFVPIPRTSELLIPAGALVLAGIAGAWVWLRRRDLLNPWLLCAAGLLITNHQLLTGLQIENYHWVYVWGPALSLVVVLLAVGGLGRLTAWRGSAVAILSAAAAAMATTGLWLRAVEAVRTRETLELMTAYAGYRAQRFGPAAPRLAADAIVAGERRFVDLAVILEDVRPLASYAVLLSPSIDDGEWETRLALNAQLLGQTRGDFSASQRKTLSENWGPWTRNPAARAERLSARLARFDAFQADPTSGADRLNVRYVALGARSPTPAYLHQGWTLLQDGPTWRIWERAAAGKQP